MIGPGREARVREMCALLRHRGPDEEGYYDDDTLSLGQCRLAIIDVEGGRQPIANETGRLQLVCNGEIYNSPDLRGDLERRGHRFRTRTDVETILHLYEEEGIACVRRLRGMFAFALWDADRKLLWLARDPLGQKPLFYMQKEGAFVFASEVKAVLASGLVEPRPDLNALWHYLSLRFLPDDYTLFEGVRKLPAASWLRLEPGGEPTISRYWTLRFEPKWNYNERALTDELDARLAETVRLHLLSDVPVGSFLSGGIDSSLVTALMAQAIGRPFPTFSIGVKEQGFNELPYARMVAQRYGLEGHEQVVEADLVHRLPAMIRQMDEPADPFGVGVYLVSKIAAAQVKVALSGDGGDENFAGYDRFAGQRLAEYYAWLPAALRRSVLRRLFDRVPETFGYKSLAQKLKWIHEMSLYSAGERYARSLGFLRFSDDHKQRLFTAAARGRLADPDSTAKILRWFEADGVEDLVDRMLYTDLMTRIPDHLLAIADRMSMAHLIEVRPPLMDPELTAFAARIPGHFKLRGRRLKYLLRRVAERHLPRALIERPKQGFGFPIAIWMRTELKDLLRALFNESRFVERGVFDGAYIRQLLDEHLGGTADHNFRLWLLLNLELWHRLYFEGETVESLRVSLDRWMHGGGAA